PRHQGASGAALLDRVLNNCQLCRHICTEKGGYAGRVGSFWQPGGLLLPHIEYFGRGLSLVPGTGALAVWRGVARHPRERGEDAGLGYNTRLYKITVVTLAYA